MSGTYPHSVFSDDLDVVSRESQGNLMLVSQFPRQLAQILQSDNDEI